MKYLYIILILTLCCPLYSQLNNGNAWNSNNQEKDSILKTFATFGKSTKRENNNILKTASIKDIDSYFPDSSLPRVKIKTPKFSSKTTVSIYMKEFIHNEWVKNEYDLIEKPIYDANTRFTAEIVADTANTKQLIIYTILPGSITLKYKSINNNKRFGAIPFKQQSTEKEIPLLFLYEKENNSRIEQNINSYLKNDSLDIIFNKEKKPFAEINRYIIIYYRSEHENN